jgi:phosphatidate cytidylyltransferase
MLIIYLILVVKASDIGAYLVGSTCGRHKLFPRVSPGKTWEGLAGGLATGVLMSVLFCAWLRLGPVDPHTTAAGHLVIGPVDAWVLGFLLSAIGVLGDLIESLLKRSAGLKDSGNHVPGMGGVLDVLDSLLFAAPALYFYLRWATGAV